MPASIDGTTAGEAALIRYVLEMGITVRDGGDSRVSLQETTSGAPVVSMPVSEVSAADFKDYLATWQPPTRDSLDEF